MYNDMTVRLDEYISLIEDDELNQQYVDRCYF